MIHIPDIHLDSLRPHNAFSAVDLRPTGNAGSYLEHAKLLFSIGFNGPGVIGKGRTGTDKAHFAQKDIYKLGQFIDTGRPEDPSELRDTRVSSESSS